MKKVTLVICCLFGISNLFGQKEGGKEKPAEVIYPIEFHVTRPLSEIVAEHANDVPKKQEREESDDREHRKPQHFVRGVKKGGIYGNDIESIQKTMGTVPGRAPLTNWAGQTATSFRPFDPTGAASATRYVQMINATTFKVFNKTTGAALLTATLGNLWSPALAYNDGDPIVLYDKAADRWFLAQFGDNDGANGNKIHIAISTTNDPAGSYYTWTYSSPAFPDYLKFGVWQDGYYMTSNQTQRVFVFERAAMLTGSATARSINQTFSPPDAGYFFVPLPGDASDGTLPGAGTPCPIFSYSDNGWGAGYIDAVNIYQVAVNWVPTTPTETITLAGNLATAAFDGSYDTNGPWNDCPQPGTSQKLDGIGGTLMFRAQWKPWTGYNTVVLNWGVKISGSQRSIKWVELRQNTSTNVWSIYQEGIYTPDAATRWLGSIAMDNNGSIGLCYLKSDATSIYPSLCYTGRRTCDPLNTLPVTEVVAKAGTGSQTGTNRDGDYSHTMLDPDGITFWHTGEYMGNGGNAGTQIYSFQITPCAGSVPVASFSGTPTTICAGSTVTFSDLSTNAPTSWAWTFAGGTPASSTSQNPTITYNTAGTYAVTLTATNAAGSSTPVTMSGYITVKGTPTTASAGAAQTVCATTATLAGNVASTGTGLWTLVSGTGTITTPTSATSGLTGLGVGANVFQWTISNSPCAASTSNVTITRSATPTTAAAGSAQTVCGTTATLAGNSPAVGTGAWSLISGAGTITTPSSPTSGITGLGVGANVFRWTISNAPCTASTSNVTITGVAAPTVANAGADQTVCATTATLAGNTAAIGIGTWTLVSGAGTITTPSSPTSGVTGLGVGANVFQWTITNAPCTASTDQVTITRSAPPSTSVAGTAQTVCGTNATLAGNTPATGAGLWTLLSGTGTITTPSSPTSSITGLGVGANTFQWTISNAPCASSTSNVTITGVATPTIANAGADQTVCASTATLAGNTVITGIGTWTLISGAGTINTPSSPTSSITGLGVGANVFQWTITNAPCTPSTDQVTITRNAPPTVSVAGSDQTICVPTATLAGNTPTTGTGLWTLVSGAGTITSPSSATSTVTGLGIGANVFQWTISNAPCTASTSQVTITRNAGPSVTVNSPSICAGTAASLTANGASTYAWSAGATSTGGANATASPTSTTTYTVTGTTAGCASTAVATVSVIQLPNVTVNSPTICAGAMATLTANGAASYNWSGGVASSSGANATANPSVTATYTVTGTTNTCSDSAISTVTVSPAPIITNAVLNQTICSGATDLFIPVSNVSNTTFSWIATSTGSVTGYANNGTGTILHTLINTGSNVATVTYIITPTGPAPGNCVGAPVSYVVTVNPSPSITNTSFNASICSGNTATYTPTSNVAGTTFGWTASTSSINISGFTANGIGNINDVLVNAGTTPQTVTYVITPIGSAPSNCIGSSVNFVATIYPTPNAIVPSDITACNGQTVAATTFTSNVSGTSFSWTNTNTSIGIGNAGNGNIPSFVAVNSLATPTTATVAVTPLGGAPTLCAGAPANYTITVDPTPATPTITQNGAVLTSSAASGNQWYLNGSIINGATGQNYTTTQNGIYTVEVTSLGCVSAISAGTNVLNTGITQLSNLFYFDVFPNPNDGNFVVSFNAIQKSTYTITLYNALGQLVYKDIVSDFSGAYSKKINIEQYAKGIYTISLTNADNQSVKKIIVY